MFTSRGLGKSFGAVRVLRDVDLEIESGEIVGLVGPNGSGKTTLLNCLSGFLNPDVGSIEYDGTPVDRLADWQVSRVGIRRTFQTASQPMKMSVLETMLCGASLPIGSAPIRGLLRRRARGSEQAAAVTKALELLDFLSLGHMVEEPAGRLSGGQKKLLSLGVALMTDPKVLLLDEPTAGVNPTLRLTIADRLKDINANGTTLLVIEHDMGFIGRMCGRVYVLDKGSVIASCRPDELKDNSRVVEAYLGAPRPTHVTTGGSRP
jgi:ABC-type branched-subunit amino acid transport system ATPase component